MHATLDQNTSYQLDIANLYAGRSWPTIEQLRYTDDGETPENYPEGDYSMEIFSDAAKKKSVMQFAGDSLVVEDNSITINRTVAQNTLHGGLYYYRVICDVSADISIQVTHGTIQVNP